MKKNYINIDELDEEMLEFYRRAPVIAVPPRQPFQVTTEVREFKIPESQVESPRRRDNPPKQRVLGGPPPDAPEGLDSDHGTRNIDVQWEVVNHAVPGDVITYNVKYRLTAVSGAFTTIATGLQELHYHLWNLNPDTRYDFKVSATSNETGEGEDSIILTVRTDVEPPPPPDPGTIPHHFELVENGQQYLYNTNPTLHFRGVDVGNVLVNYDGVQPIYANDLNGDPNFPSFILLNSQTLNRTTPVYLQFTDGLASAVFSYIWRSGAFNNNNVNFGSSPMAILDQGFGFVNIRGRNP